MFGIFALRARLEAVVDFGGVSILPISHAVRDNRVGFLAFSEDRNAAA
jgi:hypothetical protein